jgi:hypothetical protein
MSTIAQPRTSSPPPAPTPANGSNKAIDAQVARVLGNVRGSEEQLRDALVLISERHERDYDISRTAGVLAGWPALHLRWLDPLLERYGRVPSERAEQLRGALFAGTRIGGMGALDDLRDVSILAEEGETSWTILFQAAKELHDEELLRVSSDAREHMKRTLRWLRTAIDHVAPETLAVAADARREAAASLPKAPDRVANIPDWIWGPVGSAATLAVVAASSLLTGTPLLFPSLGPTAALVATQPASPTSRLWNILVGHLGGIAAGFLALLAFGALHAPTLFRDQVLDPGRAWASVLALALTILLGIAMRASHPPAAATTLLVTLGGIQRTDQVIALAMGVVLVGLVGEALRRLRLERLAPAQRYAPKDGAMSRWIGSGRGAVEHPPG